MSDTRRRLLASRGLLVTCFGKLSSQAVLILGVGILLATCTLAWFGYVAIREWRRNSELLLEQRQVQALALASLTLERDMRGASTIFLVPASWDAIQDDPPYSFEKTTSAVFNRFSYVESVLLWKRSAHGQAVCYTFNHVDRPPVWQGPGEKQDVYPIEMRKDPPGINELVSTIRKHDTPGRPFLTIMAILGNTPHEIVVHFLPPSNPSLDEEAFVAFTVNLNWVRSKYFGPLLQEVATIGGENEALSFSVKDDTGQTVAVTGRQVGEPVLERNFPLLFIDPLVVRAARHPDKFESWSLAVGLSSDSVSGGPIIRRTFALIVISTLATIAALLLTLRAVVARTALANMKSDFVSAVTHELKTPVATIRLVADTLAKRNSTQGAIQEYARILGHETNRLSQSIDQILTYARYSESQHGEAGTAHFAELDLRELIETCLDNMRPVLEAAGLEWTLDLPVSFTPVVVDREAITRAVENIVDNAIKYSNGTPVLHVSAQVGRKLLSLRFRDNGMGIPPQDLEHVWERFHRGRNVNRSGSGLGLAIVKRILEYHKGYALIRSTLNVGTEVELLIPIARS